MSPERWMPVEGFEGLYAVSDAGQVRSLARAITVRCRWGGTTIRLIAERVLAPAFADGYPRVTLYRDGEHERRLVHHMVAAAFIGPRPSGLWVLHGDGVRTNCALDNLRYGTPTENVADAFSHDVVPVGERAYNAKFTDREAAAIKGCKGVSRRLSGALATHFGVRRTYVHHLWTGLTWDHVEPLPLSEALQVLSAVKIPAHHVADFCRDLFAAFKADEPGRPVVMAYAAAGRARLAEQSSDLRSADQ